MQKKDQISASTFFLRRKRRLPRPSARSASSLASFSISARSLAVASPTSSLRPTVKPSPKASRLRVGLKRCTGIDRDRGVPLMNTGTIVAPESRASAAAPSWNSASSRLSYCR